MIPCGVQVKSLMACLNNQQKKETSNMTITAEHIAQSDTAILATFNSMEEGVEYVLNDYWFAELNRVRKDQGHPILHDKIDFTFSRKGETLFYSHGVKLFDFKGKTNLAFDLALALAGFTFSSIFTFSLSFALEHNGIEKSINTVSDEQAKFITKLQSVCRAELSKCGFYSYGLSTAQEEAALRAAVSIAIDSAVCSSMDFEYSRLALSASLLLR